MKLYTAFFWAAAASAVAASPLKRRADFCGDWDSVVNGVYTTYNNLWGKSTSGVSGSQCTGVDSFNSNTISWHTSWSWSGVPYQVKSYANTVVDITAKQLSAIQSINTIWSWSYTGDNIVANVAYDLFTSSSPTGSEEYEIMIWLGSFGGVGPISSTGSPIATPSVAGSSWTLYKGPNGSMTVFSFVANANINSFSGNLNDFVAYLTSAQGLPASQYLIHIGAGTEPFTGSNAKLTTSSYTISFR